MISRLICFLRGHEWYAAKPCLNIEVRVCSRCYAYQSRTSNQDAAPDSEPEFDPEDYGRVIYE